MKWCVNRERKTFHVTLRHSPIATVAPPLLAPQPVGSSSVTTHHLCNSYYARSFPSLSNTMISSGFTNAPVSQFLVFSTVIGALVATLTDTRYYLHIAVVPHIWTYGQFWRFLTWQVRYISWCLGSMVAGWW
jgi:hypothetical protein